MNSRWWFILGCVAGAVLLGGLETSHATRSPADKCRQAKHGAASRYVTCLQRAESRYVGHKDPAARAIAVRKCAAKFDVAWIKIEAAGGSACPSAGDAAAIREVLADTAADLASRLGGGPPAGCSGELGTCRGRLAVCPRGGFDPSFGDRGRVVGPGPARDFLLQQDGKVLVYTVRNDPVRETTSLVLTRHLQDGSLDQSFGAQGMLVTSPVEATRFRPWTAPLVLPDGSLVVGGVAPIDGPWSHIAMARYKVDGSLDRNFGSSGVVVTPVGYQSRLAVLAFDGERILAAGSYSLPETDYLLEPLVLVRYNLDGTLDSSFGSGGFFGGIVRRYSPRRANSHSDPA